MIDTTLQNVSEKNRLLYQRLKLSVDLGLRRQIFLAVCDDLWLRDCLADRLENDLAHRAKMPQRSPEDGTGSTTFPGFVSLTLNLSDPNPMAQIADWLGQNPASSSGEASGNLDPSTQRPRVIPGFQMLGVERLTRQSAAVQRLFLSYLQGAERSLLELETTLVLWMPRPWMHSIRQSAPEFWRWRTGVFEFEGEPTPTLISASRASTSRHLTEKGSDRAAIAVVERPIDSRSEPSANNRLQNPEQDTVAKAPAPIPATVSKEEIWQILKQDLAKFGNLHRDLLSFPDTQPASPLEQPRVDPAVNREIDRQQLQRSRPEKTHPDRPLPNPPTSGDVDPDVQRPSSQTFVPSPTPPLETSAFLAPLDPTAVPREEQAIPPTSPFPAKENSQHPAWPSDGDEALAPLEVTSASVSFLPQIEELKTQSSEAREYQLLRYIEQLQLQQASRSALALAYQQLGNVYRDRIEQGDNAQLTLMAAIQAYEQVIEYLEFQPFAPPTLNGNQVQALPVDLPTNFWPDLLNDLGNLYWMLSHCPPHPKEALIYLQKGIQTYHLALQQIDPATQAQSYSLVQNNLGAAYGDLARHQTPVESLQHSVAAYRAALQHRHPEVEPLKYAATQNNIGTTYWNLAQHSQPVENLKCAIAAYTEALCYCSLQQEPLSYAMIQNNLGTAYWNLSQYDPSETYLRLAIDAYQIALKYRTAEVAPTACAATNNNLGTAYWHLSNQAKENPTLRQEALTQAIAAYEQTLHLANSNDAVNTKALSFDVLATYNNLGLAYYQKATDARIANNQTEQVAYLEKSLQHHLAALEGWQDRSELYQAALGYIVQTVQAFHDEYGLQGQNQAMSSIPGHLLPEIMRRLR